MQRVPRWSQNRGGPLADSEGTSVVPKRRGPYAHAAGASAVPKRRRPPHPCHGGLSGPKMEEAPTPMWWRPRWSQRGGGPRAHAKGA